MKERARSARPGRLVTLGLPLLLAWSFLLRAWMATPELTARRFWDERFGRENIHSLLTAGEIRPANGFHPSLSYLPQAALLAASQALHRATGAEVFAVFQGRREFTPTGYLLCRLLQAAFGTLSLYLTYRAGRRLFSARVGLAGALLLAVMQWHIRQSVIFKPDILLVLTSLLAFLWSLDAAERQTWRGYVRAGSGVGLALASKFNAGPIALPLAVAALAYGGWRDWRRWGWLALAGGMAVAMFLILNPFLVLAPGLYIEDFGGTLKDYASKGARHRSSHWYVAWHGLVSLLSESFHGAAVGVLAVLGILALAVAVVRGPRGEAPGGPPPARRIGWAMLLSYVLGYALIYSLASTNPSPHNWLMVAPYTALAAAWTAGRIWKWLASRWSALEQRGTAAAAAAVAVAWLVLPACLFAYRTVVPMTWVVAQRHLLANLQPLAGRIVYYERGEWRLVLKASQQQKAVSRAVERLDRVPAGVLDRADAELFRGDRLSGSEGDFYRRRIAAAAPHQVVRFEPALFEAVGPSLVALIHPWQPAGHPLPLALSHPGGAAGLLGGRLPAAVQPGDLVSLEVHLPREWRKHGVRRLTVSGEPLALASVVAAGERVFTDRFVVAEPGAPLVVHLGRDAVPGDREIRVRLHRWRR